VRKIINESGLRDISALSKRYPKAEIYFHQDLDGVTTAIAMKKYLEDNGIDVVGAHVIQYGDKEFSVKKNDAQGDTMPVLVDFAHGKPMFTIGRYASCSGTGASRRCAIPVGTNSPLERHSMPGGTASRQQGSAMHA
jgi:hypothetical protein